MNGDKDGLNGGTYVKINRVVSEHGPATLADLRGERDALLKKLIEITAEIVQVETLWVVSDLGERD